MTNQGGNQSVWDATAGVGNAPSPVIQRWGCAPRKRSSELSVGDSSPCNTSFNGWRKRGKSNDEDWRGVLTPIGVVTFQLGLLRWVNLRHLVTISSPSPGVPQFDDMQAIDAPDGVGGGNRSSAVLSITRMIGSARSERIGPRLA